MKNKLHITLKKGYRSSELTVFEPEVSAHNTLDMDHIIDEIIHEGLAIDKEKLRDAIRLFYQKTAHYALNGYTLYTKLSHTRERPDIPWKEGQIHLTVRQIGTNDISTKTNKDEQNEHISPPQNTTKHKQDGLFAENEEPACGVEFRKWLWKSK